MGTLHYVFHCRCSRPIVLPVGTIEHIIVPPIDPSTLLRSVGLVCAHCKRVRSYPLGADSPHYDPIPPAILAPQSEEIRTFAGWLKCDTESCTTRLPLFSLRSVPIDAEARHKE